METMIDPRPVGVQARPTGALARVLVVEDDEDLRHALGAVLLERGLSVMLAGNGREAVDLQATGRCDVVVCDIRLPGLTGFEVAKRLRLLQPRPRVILITAYPDWKVYDEAYDVGAVGLLRKPLDLEAFATYVERTACNA